MSGQVISPEKGRLLSRSTAWWTLLGWLLWGLAMAGALTFLLLRLLPLSTSGPLTSLSLLHALAQPMIALVYLAGYLVPVVRRWYSAPTPPEAWKPDKRASNMLEAWLTHLPTALIGLVLVISAAGLLLPAHVMPRGVFFALAEFGMGALLFLRSTALGEPMFTTPRGRRWFFGGLALLLVPLYGTLAVQALGQFNTAVAVSVLGILAFAYSLAISAFTFYGVRALIRASPARALEGILSASELEAFKEPAPPLTWWRRHRAACFAWLPLLIALGVLTVGVLFFHALQNRAGAPRNGALSIWSGTFAGTLFIVAPMLLFYARSYRGLQLHAQLLEAQEWGAARVTPERRRALAHKMAPAFSVTVLLAGLTCGALMNALDLAGLFSGIEAGLRSLAGPERASDTGGDFLRWLANSLPDLLVYGSALAGALIYASAFLARPFKRGQLIWRAKMLAAEEARRTRIWATLVQRVEGAASELGEPDMFDQPLAPFPPELSDGMLALVYELSKERIERYKAVSLHPFGALGRLRGVGATLLLAVPGFLLNHLNFIGQFFGVK